MSHEGYVLGHFSYYLFVFCISFVFDLIYFRYISSPKKLHCLRANCFKQFHKSCMLCVWRLKGQSREKMFSRFAHTLRVVKKIFDFVVSRKFLRNFLRISRNFARHEIEI